MNRKLLSAFSVACSLFLCSQAGFSQVFSEEITGPSLNISGPASVGSLSVTGSTNNLSLGTSSLLSSETTYIPGVCMSFVDSGTSQLRLTAAQPLHDWIWERNGLLEAVPMMRLDSSHVLRLYSSSGVCGLTLNPNPGGMLLSGTGNIWIDGIVFASAFSGNVSASSITSGTLSDSVVVPAASITSGTLGINVVVPASRISGTFAGGTFAGNLEVSGSGAQIRINGNPALTQAAADQLYVSGTILSLSSPAVNPSSYSPSVVFFGGTATSYGCFVGPNASAGGEGNGYGGIAIGPGASSSEYQAIAVGAGATSIGDSSIAIGNSAQAGSGGNFAWFGNASVAVGECANANGPLSVAMGYSAVANGIMSNAIGKSAFAGGFASSAIGGDGCATGDYSNALGGGIASGNYSTAFGNCNASGYGQFVVGQYNLLQGDPANWVPTDDLFIIGNGDGTGYLDQDGFWQTNRSNALVVKKNGDTTIFGGLTLAGSNATILSGSGNIVISGTVIAPAFAGNIAASSITSGSLGSAVSVPAAAISGTLLGNVSGANLTGVLHGSGTETPSFNSLGIGTSATNAKLRIDTGAGTNTGLIIKGTSSQTADWFQTQDGTGNPLIELKQFTYSGSGTNSTANGVQINGSTGVDGNTGLSLFVARDDYNPGVNAGYLTTNASYRRLFIGSNGKQLYALNGLHVERFEDAPAVIQQHAASFSTSNNVGTALHPSWNVSILSGQAFRNGLILYPGDWTANIMGDMGGEGMSSMPFLVDTRDGHGWQRQAGYLFGNWENYTAYSKPHTRWYVGGDESHPLMDLQMTGELDTFLQNPASKGLVIKGAASQTGDLTQWQNNAGAVLAKVDALGNATFSGTVSAATLEVAGIINLTGTLIQNGNVFTGGDGNASGPWITTSGSMVTLNSAPNGPAVIALNSGDGSASFANNAVQVTSSGNLSASGGLAVTGTAQMNGAMLVSGSTTVTGGLVVTGSSVAVPDSPVGRKIVGTPTNLVLIPEQGDLSMGEFIIGTKPE